MVKSLLAVPLASTCNQLWVGAFHYHIWHWSINFPYPLSWQNVKEWTKKKLRIYAAEKRSVELIRVRHFLLVVQSYLDFLLPSSPSQQHPSFFASAVFQRTAPPTLRNCVPKPALQCVFSGNHSARLVHVMKVPYFQVFMDCQKTFVYSLQKCILSTFAHLQ